MLGLRTRPSSRALNDALNLLNAVGSDKAKVKILEEIKQAQAKYEAVVERSREEKKAADKAKAEAIEALHEASAAQANASKAYDSFLREKEEFSERISAKEAELAARERSLDALTKEFGERRNYELAELDKKRKALGDVERLKKQAETLMAEASNLRTKYKAKLAKLVTIANEE
jgi:hypothetical protein